MTWRDSPVKLQTVRTVNEVSCEFHHGKVTPSSAAPAAARPRSCPCLPDWTFLPPGSIDLEGRSTSELDRDEYRLNHVSVIYQNFNLFQHLTVPENAAYPLYIRKMPGKESNALSKEKLRHVGLKEDQFKRMPNMLSVGEQQRVAIARSLASGSEIILADEPTGNLDSTNSQNIVEILRQLVHEVGRCVIIVTHDPAVAEAAVVVLKMKDGHSVP